MAIIIGSVPASEGKQYYIHVIKDSRGFLSVDSGILSTANHYNGTLIS